VATISSDEVRVTSDEWGLVATTLRSSLTLDPPGGGHQCFLGIGRGAPDRQSSRPAVSGLKAGEQTAQYSHSSPSEGLE
jgi:hypothetical protein